MSELEVFLRLAFFGLAIILFMLSLLSFMRTKETKIALATVGFGLFAFEGLILAGSIFCDRCGDLVSISFLVGVNFLALIFLYFSIIKR